MLLRNTSTTSASRSPRGISRSPLKRRGGSTHDGGDEHHSNDPLDLERSRVRGAASKTTRRMSRRGWPARRAGRGRDESESSISSCSRYTFTVTEAREQLITMYLPLVRSLARRYASRGEHFDDLVR